MGQCGGCISQTPDSCIALVSVFRQSRFGARSDREKVNTVVRPVLKDV
jgi:hypothetical protein